MAKKRNKRNKKNQADNSTKKAVDNSKQSTTVYSSLKNFMSNARPKIESMNSKMQAKSDQLAKSFENLTTASKLFGYALKGTMAALTLADTIKGQQGKLQAMTGPKGAGGGLYQYAAQYAKKSSLSKDQSVMMASSFMPYTRDIGQLEKMMKYAERLNALDPSKGVDHAVASVKAMMSGDVSGVRQDYGVSIDEGQLKEKRAAGDADGMLSMMDEGLNNAGATEELVGERFALLGAQVSEFKDNLMTAIGEAAIPVMESLAHVMIRLNENLQAGKYQPFINLMTNGMYVIGNVLAFVSENADWLIQILGGVTFGIVALNFALAITKLLTANVVDLLMMAVGLFAGVAGFGVMIDSMGAYDVGPQASSPSATALKESLDGKLGTTTMDVNIANSDPVKVSGEVDIEKENMKYMLDVAGARFFAVYSTATMAPQVTVQNMQVSQNADADMLLGYVADGLAVASASAPQGVYGK